MQNTKTSRILSGAVGVIVVLGILIAVNSIFAHVRLRTDMTEDQIYTLSEGTTAMLQQLDRTITLKFYFSKDNPEVPIPIKNYANRVTDFLHEIASHSDGQVSVEVLNPEPDSDAEEWAQRYGLTPQATGALGMQPDLYLGLVAVSGAREAAIPFLAPALEPQMEYLVIRLIQEVRQDERPAIGIMSTLPVMEPPASPWQRGQQPQDWYFVQELKRQYDVQAVPVDSKEIPDRLDTLMLIHPRDLSEETLYAVDQFLLQGGHLLVFIDPLCMSEEKEMDPMQGMPSLSSDINRLSSAWGIEMPAGQVVADVAAATQVTLGDGRTERLPAWLSLRAGRHIDEDEIITGMLERLMMPFAGTLEGKAIDTLTKEVLLAASDEAVTVNAFQAQHPAMLNTMTGKAAPDAPLGIRLRGTFKTAFPDGRPVSADDTNAPAATAAGLTESEKEGVVIIFSDVDMLANAYSVRGLNVFGQTLYRPINDNLNLALNTVEQLAGNEALIGLRSRGSFDRPFDRVLVMEKEAQLRWQEEEQKLQQKLQQTQQRINELQSAKSEDQQLILSPEQKAEIERFREERFETQRQLKNVRKKLRSDIERLGITLKVINIAAVPILVALFGMVLWWHRHKKAMA